jgi:hypothetical protein
VKPPELYGDSSYFEILAELNRVVDGALEYLKREPADDRNEFEFYGFTVAVRRIRLNTKVGYHVTYSAPHWRTRAPLYDRDRVATIFYDHRGRCPRRKG